MPAEQYCVPVLAAAVQPKLLLLHTKLDELGTALEEELLGIELDEEGFEELELAMELELKIEEELETEEELFGIELDELKK